MTIRERIITFCQDEELTNQELVEKLERQIVKLLPYNHDEGNPMEACNIHNDISMEIVGSGTASEIVEKIEASVSKRKMAFILFKKINDEKNGGKGLTLGRDPRAALLDQLKRLSDTMDNKDGISKSEKSPDTCTEEDDSDCWKCRHNGTCNKFSN